jgi:hypothetical protein
MSGDSDTSPDLFPTRGNQPIGKTAMYAMHQRELALFSEGETKKEKIAKTKVHQGAL